MIKVDIVNEVSKIADITKVKAEVAVDAVFDAMRISMQRGERIELRGFGVFQVKPRKRGIGRNPAPARKSASRRAARSASSQARISRISADGPLGSLARRTWSADVSCRRLGTTAQISGPRLAAREFVHPDGCLHDLGRSKPLRKLPQRLRRRLPIYRHCLAHRGPVVQRHDPRDPRLPRDGPLSGMPVL